MELPARLGEPLSERLHAVIVPNFDVLRERKIVNVRDVIRFDVENLSLLLPGAKRISSFDLRRDPLPRTESGELNRAVILRRVQSGDSEDFSRLVSEEPAGEEALWLSDPRVQKAIAVIRQSGKARKAVLPESNLELDLGFDSIERAELLVALETALGVEVDAKVISTVYTVRELVDTILNSGRDVAKASATESDLGWDHVLSTPPEDQRVISVLNVGLLPTLAWFVFGKFVSLLAHVFFRLRVTGKDKLPQNGPLILSPNHQSFIDPPIVASQIPWRLFKSTFYLGTTEIFGKGILGFLSRTFRLLPVDPDSNLVEGMRAAAFGLKKGYNLVLYPEGERTIDGAPKTFKRGVAILSTHFRVPIYPVALDGFYDAWPRGKRWPRLSKLRICFGDPIEPPAESGSEEIYLKLTERLRDRVVEMWESLHEAPNETASHGRLNLELADDVSTVTLYRPVGQKELDLIAASEYRLFPPRLPDQPIFYPVLNREYAEQIARDWNTRDDRSGFVGYVLEFQVDAEYLERHEIKKVGATAHLEYWIPAEELVEFNRRIHGKIRVIKKYGPA